MKILLDILPIIILAICVIAFIFTTQNLRKEVKALKKVKETLKNEIEQDKEILEDLNHLELKTRENIIKLLGDQKAALKDKEAAMQSAAEAQVMANRMLASEQERARALIDAEKTVREERLNQEFKEKRQSLEASFEKKKKELDYYYTERKDAIENEISICEEGLNQFRRIQEAVNEAVLRNKELKEKSDFYSIQVSNNDKEDIQILQQMDLRLHHRDVIPKIIWELFIRRPVQEMEKRVIGTSKKSGIYKITNKETGEAYIGKTSDFATRWQNHIKTAIGLDGAAHATLHTRLAQDGLWNYTFEILEEVDKEHLSEREAFYIDLYGTKSQLNMKEGVKNGIN